MRIYEYVYVYVCDVLPFGVYLYRGMRFVILDSWLSPVL